MIRCLLALIAVCWVRVSAAANLPDGSYHALPCRPTIACTADLVPPGVAEIEIGYLLRKLNGAVQHSTPWLLKLTLAEWVQLQIASNGAVFTSPGAVLPARYQDDIAVGFKLHAQDQTRDAPSLSFSGQLSVPISVSQQGYLRTYDALFTIYLTKDLRWLHADLNAGLNLWRVEGQPLPQGFGALALSVELPRHFGLMVEGYGFSDASPVAPADAGVLGAVSFTPRPWLVLDLGGDAGLLQANRSFSLFAGLTLIPVDLWDTAAERQRRAALPR